MRRITLAAAIVAAAASVNRAGAVEIYIIEDSGFFGQPGITLGTLARVDSANPSAVTIVGNVGDQLNYGGIDFRPGQPLSSAFYGFENTTNSVRSLGLTGGQSLLDSVGHVDSGIAGITFSNDGSLVYCAGNANGFGRIMVADANTGELISVHNFVNVSIGALATVPAGTALPYTPGEIWGIVNTTTGVQLQRFNLADNTRVVVGAVLGIGFNAAFESGLDWAPDGTLYAAFQGTRFVGGEPVPVSSHLYTVNPANAQATNLGPIQFDGAWDVSSICVAPAPPPSCPGDANGDGLINAADLSVLLANFGTSTNGGASSGDFNKDGQVNGADLSVLLGQFGGSC